MMSACMPRIPARTKSPSLGRGVKGRKAPKYPPTNLFGDIDSLEGPVGKLHVWESAVVRGMPQPNK